MKNNFSVFSEKLFRDELFLITFRKIDKKYSVIARFKTQKTQIIEEKEGI